MTNPIYSKEDNPRDVLNRVSYVMAYLKESCGERKGDMTLTEEGKSGLQCILEICEVTTRQVAKDMGD